MPSQQDQRGLRDPESIRARPSSSQPSTKHVIPRAIQECQRQKSGVLSRQTGLSGQDRSLSSSLRRGDQTSIRLPDSRPNAELPRKIKSENQNVASSTSDSLPDRRVKLDLIAVTHLFKDTAENVESRRPFTDSQHFKRRIHQLESLFEAIARHGSTRPNHQGNV